ncbi:MAG TPA: SDR family oxidoreductase [Candidatus Limnocylindrales bacterium]|nr:SDR family oxidoreductase [Candidatus Limnocylindrales bacterium]
MNENKEPAKTVFVTGGSGFLGWNLVKALKDHYRVFAGYYHHPFQMERVKTLKLNISDKGEVREVLKKVQPDLIFHTAALARVEVCEKDKESAYRINVEGTRNLILESPKNSRFIYVSTDLVFNGKRSFYKETDLPDPLNFYGETKLLGEVVTAENAPDYLIIRISLMYGFGNSFSESFLDWLRKTWTQGGKTKLFTDQYRTPLLVSEAVEALKEVATISTKREIFHLGGRERITRYEFGKKFAELYGYPIHLIEPASMASVLTVNMPADCSFSINKIQNLLSFTLSDVEEGLKKLYQEDQGESFAPKNSD